MLFPFPSNSPLPYTTVATTDYIYMVVIQVGHCTPGVYFREIIFLGFNIFSNNLFAFKIETILIPSSIYCLFSPSADAAVLAQLLASIYLFMGCRSGGGVPSRGDRLYKKNSFRFSAQLIAHRSHTHTLVTLCSLACACVASYR